MQTGPHGVIRVHTLASAPALPPGLQVDVWHHPPRGPPAPRGHRFRPRHRRGPRRLTSRHRFGGVAMIATVRPNLWTFPLSILVSSLLVVLAAGGLRAGPKPETYWQVDDVRPGMKGQGKTVLRGTKVETFDAEVLGVLKNTSPGRDMVVCRLSGLDLEKTGVIAGMSGSPVSVEGKLLGAVAFAWPYGKAP